MQSKEEYYLKEEAPAGSCLDRGRRFHFLCPGLQLQESLLSVAGIREEDILTNALFGCEGHFQ